MRLQGENIAEAKEVFRALKHPAAGGVDDIRSTSAPVRYVGHLSHILQVQVNGPVPRVNFGGLRTTLDHPQSQEQDD